MRENVRAPYEVLEYSISSSGDGYIFENSLDFTLTIYAAIVICYTLKMDSLKK